MSLIKISDSVVDLQMKYKLTNLCWDDRKELLYNNKCQITKNIKLLIFKKVEEELEISFTWSNERLFAVTFSNLINNYMNIQ